MSRKGIIGLGPALMFVNLFALLASLLGVIGTLGLVSGIAFNKSIRKTGFANLAPRVLIFLFLSTLIVLAVHLVGGPASNHYVGMLIGSFAFAAITAALSTNSFREDPRQASITVAVLSILFLAVAEAAVFIATR